MRRALATRLTAAGIACALLAALPAAYAEAPLLQAPAPPQPLLPQPTPAPTPVHPALARIRAALEKAGYKVISVLAGRRSGGETRWIVITAATYVQPSAQTVTAQAFASWGAMYTEFQNDPPGTGLRAGQVWTKYLILLDVTVGDVAAYLREYGAARAPAEQNQAYQQFLGRVLVNVVDLERNQEVDVKDFINKNFVR